MKNVSQKIEYVFNRAKLLSTEEKFRFCALISSRISPEYTRFCRAENLKDEKVISQIILQFTKSFPSSDELFFASRDISLIVPDCDIYPGRDCIFAQNAAFCALNFCEYAGNFDDTYLRNCIANFVDTIDYFIQDLLGVSGGRTYIDKEILNTDVFKSEVEEEFERYFSAIDRSSDLNKIISDNINGQSVVDRWSQPLAS